MKTLSLKHAQLFNVVVIAITIACTTALAFTAREIAQGQSKQSARSHEFIQADLGLTNDCALLGDGSIQCWGVGDVGTMRPPRGPFSMVTTGGRHSCALRANGSVTCWGSNEFGQLLVPKAAFQQISAGYHHTCGVTKEHKLMCWGGHEVISKDPPAGHYVQVSAGFMYNCALSTEAEIVCWGTNPSTPMDGLSMWSHKSQDN